jgi:hypothetical protein
MIIERADAFWRLTWDLHDQTKDMLKIHYWIRKQVIIFASANDGNAGSDHDLDEVSPDEIIPSGSPAPGEGRSKNKQTGQEYGPVNGLAFSWGRFCLS